MTLGSARWSALGTSVHVLVADPTALGTARRVVDEELRHIDLACSRFRSDSELARVNGAAGARVRVSPLLREAVEVALRVAQATDGAVVPTVGAAMRAIGYDRDFAQGLHRGTATATVPGCDAVRLDGDTLSVDGELDLGATAKALAADRAARAVFEATASGTLVNLGGDIAIAGGAPLGGWRVRVGDDHAATSGGQTIALQGGGLATSSTTVRRWDGAHHIVDPRTGRSCDVVWRTVSVAAGSCLDANAASTASIVIGEDAPDWLRERGIPARLVRADGEVVCVAGWPA